MKKNKRLYGITGYAKFPYQKILKKMKLTLIVVLISTVQIMAVNAFSQSSKFTLSKGNSSIEDVLKLIEDQSDYYFLYNGKLVDVQKKINIKVENQSIEKTLDELLKGTDITYRIHNRQIILSPEVNSTTVVSDINITGKVTDSSGAPLPGVTVVVKGTTNGTITDFDGKYTLANIPADATLVFSFVGMKSQEIAVAGKTTVNISLVEETVGIEEVVAVGYGSMKRSDITGSLSTVKVDEKDAAQMTTVDKLLQGRAAGVDVVSGNGAPGAAINVKIRGTGTLTGNSEPLYVVDGVIINTSTQEVSQAYTNGNYSQESQNGLTALNPQDIESVEILKDASATAVYGSRGANGVVLITTKSGKTGKGKIIFSSNTDISTMSKKIPVLSGKEFALYDNELSGILGEVVTFPKDEAGLNALQTIDWQDYSTRTAISQNYRLTMSGKTDKTNYYIAGGYADYQGIIKNSGLKKGDIRMNLVQDVNPRLKVSSNTGITFQQNNWIQGTVKLGQANASMIRAMLRKSPLIGFDEDQTNVDEFMATNSPQTWFDEFEDKSKEFRVISSLNFDYKISKVFTYRLVLGGDYRSKTRQQFFGPGLWVGSMTNGKATYSRLDYYSYDVENLLDFNKRFGKLHKLNGTIGVTYDYNFTENSATYSENFFSTTLMSDGITLGQVYYPYYFGNMNASVLSTLARGVYNYSDKYIVTLTGRLDGSSKFAKGEKFGFFPSIATAWRADQEEFIKKLNVFSNLKVRVGWGQTGVQTIGSYQTKTLYDFVQNPNGSKGLEVGQVPSRISNENLTWETSTQFNAGLDMGFFANRFSVNIDIYKKTSNNLLQNFNIAPSSGFKTIALNIGSIENKGLEITFDGRIVDKTVKWSLGGNFAINRNMVAELGLSPSIWGTEEMIAFTGNGISTYLLQSPANIFAEGHPVGMFWGYKTDGICQESDMSVPVKYKGVAMVPGDVKIIDQNGDGLINDYDKTFIGDPNPDFTYGISTSLAYKNLKLDVFINGVFNRDICNANLFYEEYGSELGGNIRKEAWINAWRSESPSNTYPRLGYTLPTDLTDRFIEDGSYIRLSNVSLSYDVPVKRSKIFSSLGVFVSGRNLLTITKYKGFDPEVNSYTFNGSLVGVDFNSYPNTKSFSFGLTAGF